MNLVKYRLESAAVVAFAITIFCGCEPTEPHVDNAHDFTSTVMELVETRDKIRDGMSAGDTHAAHGPLHAVGHQLHQLGSAAKAQGLSDEDLAAVDAAKEKLMDAFGAVDEKLHNAKMGKEYSEVSAEIDETLKIITDIAGVKNETAANGSAAKPVAAFPEIVAQIVESRNKIRDGFAANNVDAAHGPLHDVGSQLEGLGKSAKQHGLSEADLAAVIESKEKLFDAFDQVDRTFHGQEGKTYDEVSAEVDAALKVITDIAGSDAAAASTDSGSATQDVLPSSDGVVVEEAASGSTDGSGDKE